MGDLEEVLMESQGRGRTRDFATVEVSGAAGGMPAGAEPGSFLEVEIVGVENGRLWGAGLPRPPPSGCPTAPAGPATTDEPIVRILVTGGAGFVGSTIALSPRRPRGAEVLALDNLRRRGSELAPERLAAGGVRFLHGDIRNPGDLDQAGDLDLVLECSAEPSVLGRYDPETTWNLSSGLTATFGDGVAVGDADGRLRLELDATRDLRIGDAVGDFGFYTGFGVDSDGDHEDAQVGLVFRLRF